MNCYLKTEGAAAKTKPNRWFIFGPKYCEGMIKLVVRVLRRHNISIKNARRCFLYCIIVIIGDPRASNDATDTAAAQKGNVFEFYI